MDIRLPVDNAKKNNAWRLVVVGGSGMELSRTSYQWDMPWAPEINCYSPVGALAQGMGHAWTAGELYGILRYSSGSSDGVVF